MEQQDVTTEFSSMGPSSNLLKCIPKSLRAKCSRQSPNNLQDILAIIYESIQYIPNYPKQDQLIDFFKQLNVNRNYWNSLQTNNEKTEYIFQCLDKNIHDSLQKVNSELNSYLNNVSNTSHVNLNASRNKNSHLKSKDHQFDWLHLNTKNQMLKPKLKTKLVQSINEYKNEKKLRAVHGRVLEDHEKIVLSDDSFDLQEDDNIKMNYEWSKEDEEIFVQNVNKLKEKFNKTEFLKNCQRYKFITNHEICTLASEEISRRLDKSNKAFLSRQFLLDKYFSTKENLTEKQMKFILKTSPLLGKCVDKTFIKAAIRNIRYQDIDKMELQIAQEIIKKFESIRMLVKKSRKQYKQSNNQKAKIKIKKFEEKSKHQFERSMVIQELQKHKVKLIRRLNYKSRKDVNQSLPSSKISWPIPLNAMHPSTGLFIRDCVNQQVNQDFNLYEKNYMKEFRNNEVSQKASRSEMIEFYSGGPLENNPQNFIQINRQMVKLICDTFKTSFYNKQLSQKLNSMDFKENSDHDKRFTSKTTKTICQTLLEMTKRTKKSDQVQETENAIREKIFQKNEKSKNALIVKKLHIFAAENSFQTLKALNPKFTPSQINTVDKKGNCALFYAIKHRNIEFIEFILSKKADVNISCSKGLTPLHMAFKTNEYSLICKCLTGYIPPNLNCLDDQNKTALYYCNRKILQMLGLQKGVVSVDNKNHKFDNNYLLQQIRQNCHNNDQLEGTIDYRKYSANQEHSDRS